MNPSLQKKSTIHVLLNKLSILLFNKYILFSTHLFFWDEKIFMTKEKVCSFSLEVMFLPPDICECV